MPVIASWWEVVGDLDVIAWIAVVIIAFLVIQGIVRIYKITLLHRERMTMIEKGIDPGPLIENLTDLLEEDADGEQAKAKKREMKEKIVESALAHRERMAVIKKGMHGGPPGEAHQKEQTT